MFLVLFSIISLIHLICASELQLNIDPLSIHVDPNLYRLCWNQTSKEKLEYLSGYSVVTGDSNFAVFNDLHQSERTFCIEKKDTESLYTIGIPFTLNKTVRILEITVKFSVPLSPPWKIIHTETVPEGIHLQLNTKIAGILLKDVPSCKVLLLYKTSNSMKMTLIELDSKFKNRSITKIDKGSSFIMYYTCHKFAFVDTSTSMYIDRGTLFSSEKTYPLRPFIQIPFRKFILALWKHPSNIPENYIITIRPESANRKCIRKFRLFKKYSLKPQKPKIMNTDCGHNVSEIDLGYYGGSGNGKISVVLNMDNLMRTYSRYKFSIFWIDLNKQLQENYIYFSPLPNENIANINPNFLNPNLEKYDNLRNETSNLYRNVVNENHANPITEPIINASGYNDFFILPSISESQYPTFKVIQSETLDNLVNKCENIPECAVGFYPFFYSLFTITTPPDIITEIIEIPRKENLKVKTENLKLLSNNKSLKFEVSWQVKDYLDFITPSLYLVEIKTLDADKCVMACIVKCKTCNNIYKKLSEENNSKNISKRISLCNSVQIIDNHYNAIDNFISFQTDVLPHTINLTASLYSVHFQSIVGPIVSHPNFLIDIPKNVKEYSTWIYLGIFIIGFCVILVFLLLLPFFCHKKSTKTTEVMKMDSNANKCEYDDDDDDESNKYDYCP